MQVQKTCSLVVGIGMIVSIPALICAASASDSTLLAFRPPTEIRQVAPPREIQEVAPPREIRQVAPPQEMRDIAPPQDIRRVQPPRDMRRAPQSHQVERHHITPPRELQPARIQRPVFRPDLRVRAIGLSSTWPMVGERVVVTARIRNSGNENARRFRVRFFAGGKQIGEETVSLSSGATETLTAAFVADTPGSQQVWVQVDPGSGKGKQVVLSRSLTVKSAPSHPASIESQSSSKEEQIKKRIRLLTRFQSQNPDKDFLFLDYSPDSPDLQALDFSGFSTDEQRIVLKALKAAGRGKEGNRQKLARLPDYHAPLDKPQAKPKVESPKGGSELGDLDKPGGRETDDFGSSSPLPDWPPGSSFKDQDLEGPFGKGHRGSKGDGIQGIHDRDGMPEIGRGPGHTFGDEGLPGGGRSTAGHGFGKDRYGAPTIKHNIGGAYQDPVDKAIDGIIARADDLAVFDAAQGKGKSGYDVEVKKFDGGAFVTIYWGGLDIDVFSVDRHGRIHSSQPGPDGQDTVHPKQDPQLLAKIAKRIPQKPKIRPDEGVSDPAGTRVGKTAEAQAPLDKRSASTGGTQAGADIKWKFGGKKPGSEVTDPAEPQGTGSGGTPDSYRAPQGFLVLDPAEPEAASIQAALGKAQVTAAKGASAETAIVASVVGNVQKLTKQGDKQGWEPLESGDNLGQGNIIRVDKNTGGEIGFSSLKKALSMSWTRIHSGPNHVLYQLQTKK